MMKQDLLVRDIVISNKSDDIITINLIEDEDKLSIDIDYTNLLSYPKSIPYNYNVKDKGKLKGYVDFSEIYENYMKGSISTTEMLESFSEEIPFVPLVFRQATVSYSENLSGELISSISDPYYNIEKLYLK